MGPHAARGLQQCRLSQKCHGVILAGPQDGQESRSGVHSGSWDPPHWEPTAARAVLGPEMQGWGGGPRSMKLSWASYQWSVWALGPWGPRESRPSVPLITRRPGHRTGPLAETLRKAGFGQWPILAQDLASRLKYAKG